MKKFLSGIARTAERKMDPRKKSAEMPDEALSQSLGEVLDFEAILDSVECCGQQLLDSMPSLRSAPSALLARFGALYSKESAGGEVIGRVSAHLDACAARVSHGMSHLDNMAQLVQRARSQIAKIREVDGARKTAWVAKLQSDQEFKSLMARRKKISNEAKSARMKSRYEAEEEFNRLSDEMRRLVHEVLSSKLSNMNAALVELGACYSKVFGTSLERTCGFAESVQHLSCLAGADTAWPDGPEIPLEALPPLSLSEKMGNDRELHSPPQSGSTQASSVEVEYPLLDSVGSSVLERTETGSVVVDVDLVCSPPLPPPARPPPEDSNRPPPECNDKVCPEERYLKGEKVSVWSESHCKWLAGIVQEVFTTGGAYKDYFVPAGVVKVESSAGIKFVPPEQLDKLVRRVPTESSRCSGGTPSRPASAGSI